MKIFNTLLFSLILLFSLNCDQNNKSEKKSKYNDATSQASTDKDSEILDNLVKSAKEWIPAHDEFGSSYDTSTAILNDSLKKVKFTLTKKTEGDKWPYIELISIIGGNLEDKSSMKLTYSCSKPLIIKLSQSDFNTKGNETYSHYQFKVPASDTLNTILLNFSDFKQPDWTPEISKSIPMKLENVDAVYFTPAVDAEVGGSAELSIKDFYIK